MGSTRTFRFRNYVITPDTTGLPTYEATCVSGDEEECGERSEEWLTEHPVVVWMAAHTAETGHTRFQRRSADYATVEPKSWQ